MPVRTATDETPRSATDAPIWRRAAIAQVAEPQRDGLIRKRSEVQVLAGPPRSSDVFEQPSDDCGRVMSPLHELSTSAGTGRVAAQAASRTGSTPVPAAAVAGGTTAGKNRHPLRSPVSWRIHRIRSAAVSGWSPNSCAIWLAQPAAPRRRTVLPIASATVPAVGASEGCSDEANSASQATSLTVIVVTVSLRGADS